MNKAELDRLINDFYLVSGMEISVLDADFHTVSMRRSGEETVCSLLHRENGVSEICKSSDVDRLNEVKSTLRPTVYTCPAGMTEAILPIVNGERIVGYIITTMGIRRDLIADAELFDTIKPLAPSANFDELKIRIEKTQHLSNEEINAYFGILAILAEHISNDETVFMGEESIGRLVKYYVKSNLQRKITLKDIARSLHCSTVTLTEHFKNEFGMTIMEYVVQKRMQYAEKLLLSTEEPLSDISSRCGFSDVEYFSRTFKKHHDSSPALWRRKHK